MNGFLLQLRRSVRKILRPIQSRSVTLCKLVNFEIVPIQCLNHFYSFFLAAT